MMAWNLLRLYHLTQEDTWQQAAQAQMEFLGGLAGAYPTAYPVYLLALLAQREPPEEITVVLAPTRGEAPLDSLGPSPWTQWSPSRRPPRRSPFWREDHLLYLQGTQLPAAAESIRGVRLTGSWGCFLRCAALNARPHPTRLRPTFPRGRRLAKPSGAYCRKLP